MLPRYVEHIHIEGHAEREDTPLKLLRRQPRRAKKRADKIMMTAEVLYGLGVMPMIITESHKRAVRQHARLIALPERRRSRLAGAAQNTREGRR